MIVAIDGPAGAGKSSVARALAPRLGFRYLDTGAMYRALTWLALQRGIALDDVPALVELAREHPGRVRRGRAASRSRGHDVTAEIREPEIDSAVPIVARHPEVREVMRERQRALGEQGDSVIEGRDIGVVVAPHAELKVWLVADPEVRAARRHAERDGIDGRRRSPTRCAAATSATPPTRTAPTDAIEVDTTLPEPRRGHRPDRRASCRSGSREHDRGQGLGRRPPDDRHGRQARGPAQGLRQGARAADRRARDRLQPLPLGRPAGARRGLPAHDLLHGQGRGASRAGPRRVHPRVRHVPGAARRVRPRRRADDARDRARRPRARPLRRGDAPAERRSRRAPARGRDGRAPGGRAR